MPRHSGYSQSIREEIARHGLVGRYKWNHVEAWMRLEHGTLNHLSNALFSAEVKVACQMVDAAGSEQSERLAETYGLKS